jgi:hypothetical protein
MESFTTEKDIVYANVVRQAAKNKNIRVVIEYLTSHKNIKVEPEEIFRLMFPKYDPVLPEAFINPLRFIVTYYYEVSRNNLPEWTQGSTEKYDQEMLRPIVLESYTANRIVDSTTRLQLWIKWIKLVYAFFHYEKKEEYDYTQSRLEVIEKILNHSPLDLNDRRAALNLLAMNTSPKALSLNHQLCEQCQVNPAEYQERNLGGLFCSEDCQKEFRVIGERTELRSQKSTRFGGTAEEKREMAARHQREMSVLLAKIQSLDEPRRKWEIGNLKARQEREKKALDEKWFIKEEF